MIQPTYYVKTEDGQFVEAVLPESQETEDTIPNFTNFGTCMVMLDVNKFNADNVAIYNPTLTFDLDDGQEDFEKYITVMTDIYEESLDDAISIALDGVTPLFDNVYEDVSIWNEDGELIGEININKFFGIDEELDECCGCGNCECGKL